jgi:hypothetical protein
MNDISHQNSGQFEWLYRWVFPVLVFLLAFFPRAVYPVSLSNLWHQRAIRFTDALATGNLRETYQSYHPGVTVLWLSGIGMRVLGWQRGLSSGQLLGLEPSQPGSVADAVAAGVIPLAFAIALCIALSYIPLKRITDRNVALVATLLMALDPFYLTHSKALHLDALLGTFMFASALFLLSYLHRAKWLDLILSGAFAGLAFLTKSPSLFLIPYAGLATGVYRLLVRNDDGVRTDRLGWGRRLWIMTRTLLIWGAASVVVFIALWPAMWVQPFVVVRSVIDGVFFHVETIHQNPIFFNGRAEFGDPGPLFYLATIAWKTTSVTLPMVCVALFFALARIRRNTRSRLTLLFIAYILFYTAQISLSNWKQTSYMVPAFPTLDVLAALGLVRVTEAIGRTRWWQSRRWLSTVLVAIAITLQAVAVLPHHPYYGVHYNALLGGSRVAQRVLPLQEQGEGLDLAAQHLGTLPRAQQARAMVYSYGASMFDRYFTGLTVIDPDPWIDYRVYYLNQIEHGLGGEKWLEAWETDRKTTPLWTADFDGVTYVWVYGTPPTELAAGGPEYTMDLRFGEHIRLSKARLSSADISPGGTLTVVLFWESDAELGEDYMIFTHVLSEGGELRAQHDGPPVYGVRATPTWRIGESIEDGHVIRFGDDLAPGEYELSVGMYDLKSSERLPVYNASGERLPEDRAVVSTLTVQGDTAGQ